MRACGKITSKLLPHTFATAIRTETKITTSAIDMTTKPDQAEHIIASGYADAV
jgi:2,4-dienoyl-CoA reductase-like NADH-dependent reductase (Old Yellow Enzyme family)